MDLGIKNKRVLITGTSQGIGRAIALEFAKEDCRVCLISRNKNKVETILEEMGGEKAGHSLYITDLLQPGASARAVQDLVTNYGFFDILIHNIGSTLNVKDVLSGCDDWYRVWYFNVGVAIEINRILIPYMKEQKWGRIIHISSISAKALRGSGPYCAAKAYLNAYTKILGKDVAKDGIVVSALMPGAIYSEGGHWDENNEINALDKDTFFRKREDFLRHHHAIGRLGTAEEIAPFAVFMASQYVTFAQGSLIPVDGGTE